MTERHLQLDEAGDVPAPPSRLAVVEAFADGEPVDPSALDEALAHDDGRAHLIDLLALRGLVAAPDGQVAVAAAVPGAGVPAAGARRGASRARAWLAAAALVGMGLAGGYVAGQLVPGQTVRDRPPVAVPEGDPAGAVAGLGAASIDAPEPTTVIRLEPGVSWDEQPSRTGGH